MKHTPAPWNVTTTQFAGGTAIMIDPVAIVLGHGQTPDANARLIGAAPDMLEALLSIKRIIQRDQLPVGTKQFDRLKAAIEKATG